MYTNKRKTTEPQQKLTNNQSEKSPFFKPRYESGAKGNQIQKKEKEGNLPDDIQMKMESSFGTDFSAVKVHTNSNMTEELNAIAYTQGSDIYFSPKYDPYSSIGQEYLGHELTHVIQQNAGIVASTHQEAGFNVNSDTGLESQADEAGKKAASGQSVNLVFNPVSFNNFSIQKKDAPIQKMPIPGSAFILDVNTTADIVLQDLRHVASLASTRWDNVNWRQRFYPAIEAQIRGKQLGSISFSFEETTGLNIDWDVVIAFSLENPVATGRSESRTVGTTQGGSSSPSLGNSETITSGVTVGVQASGANAPGGVGFGGNVSGGVSDSNARAQTQGTVGGISGGQSQSSRETVNRFIANLYTSIDVQASFSFGGIDYINPFAYEIQALDSEVNHHAFETMHIGTITYDRPQY